MALVGLVACLLVAALFYMIGVAVGVLPFDFSPFGGPSMSGSAEWTALGIGVPVVLLLVGAILFPMALLTPRCADRLRPGSTLWRQEKT